MTTTDSRHDTTADARPHSPDREAALDAALDALADQRCRELVCQLADADDDVFVVTDLVDRLVDARERDVPVDERRLRGRLHHRTLPKLADANVVEYDADRGTVEYRPDSRVTATLSAMAAFESNDYPISLDALFGLLAADRRRVAYRTLLAHDDLSLPDLADEVAVAEHGRPLPNVDPDDVLSVYLSLYHTHVPKLADAGLVEYRQADDHVALTAAGRELETPARALCDV